VRNGAYRRPHRPRLAELSWGVGGSGPWCWRFATPPAPRGRIPLQLPRCTYQQEDPKLIAKTPAVRWRPLARARCWWVKGSQDSFGELSIAILAGLFVAVPRQWRAELWRERGYIMRGRPAASATDVRSRSHFHCRGQTAWSGRAVASAVPSALALAADGARGGGQLRAQFASAAEGRGRRDRDRRRRAHALQADVGPKKGRWNGL